jgi:hypothetical protein
MMISELIAIQTRTQNRIGRKTDQKSLKSSQTRPNKDKGPRCSGIRGDLSETRRASTISVPHLVF